MFYSTLVVPLLVAAGAMAAPQASYSSGYGKELRVVLSGAGELVTQTAFTEPATLVQGAPVGSSGPFQKVELKLGADVTNKALRCKIFGADGNAIILTRGNNTDVAFSDGGSGPWTIRAGSATVTNIVCDQSFKKAGPEASEIRVVLENQSIELGTQTAFMDTGKRQATTPIGSDGPFNTVELRLGDVVDPNLRCQITDAAGNKIFLKRGNNTDVSFGDAKKGAWTFLAGPSAVATVTCDPTFKKAAPEDVAMTIALEHGTTEAESVNVLTFNAMRQEVVPAMSAGPFETVTLTLGSILQAELAGLRCQILDVSGSPITVIRGPNVAQTFGDAKKGAWTLKAPSSVSKIVCDPAFTKA